jgi:hypothetical protein
MAQLLAVHTNSDPHLAERASARARAKVVQRQKHTSSGARLAASRCARRCSAAHSDTQCQGFSTFSCKSMQSRPTQAVGVYKRPRIRKRGHRTRCTLSPVRFNTRHLIGRQQRLAETMGPGVVATTGRDCRPGRVRKGGMRWRRRGKGGWKEAPNTVGRLHERRHTRVEQLIYHYSIKTRTPCAPPGGCARGCGRCLPSTNKTTGET